jgi:hypothetical protein
MGDRQCLAYNILIFLKISHLWGYLLIILEDTCFPPERSFGEFHPQNLSWENAWSLAKEKNFGKQSYLQEKASGVIGAKTTQAAEKQACVSIEKSLPFLAFFGAWVPKKRIVPLKKSFFSILHPPQTFWDLYFSLVLFWMLTNAKTVFEKRNAFLLHSKISKEEKSKLKSKQFPCVKNTAKSKMLEKLVKKKKKVTHRR